MNQLLAEEMLNALLAKLDTVKTKETTKLLYYKKSIDLCVASISEIKSAVKTYSFESDVEEIQFFKYTKPEFFSRYLYYLKMYQLESSKRLCSTSQYANLLREELNIIDQFIEKNKSFCDYYLSKANYLDDQYFLRKNYNLSLEFSDNLLERDPYFSTAKDFTLTKLLANVHLKKNIENNLYKEQNAPVTDIIGVGTLKWHSSKTDLVELIYALSTRGCIKEDIDQIAKTLQSLFNLDLGNYYKTWSEIRMRKKEKTKFLNHLANHLLLKMEEYD